MVNARVNGVGDVAYPKLMIHEDETVVLFESESVGVCIRATGDSYVGEYARTWDMDQFSDLKGSITLSNEG